MAYTRWLLSEISPDEIYDTDNAFLICNTGLVKEMVPGIHGQYEAMEDQLVDCFGWEELTGD